MRGNELSSVITQTVPLVCTHQELSFELRAEKSLAPHPPTHPHLPHENPALLLSQ